VRAFLARTKSAAHQRYPITPIAKSAAPATRDKAGTATLSIRSLAILCGIQIPTTSGTNSVNNPVFIAFEAVLMVATIVLRTAIVTVISC
jgi:hypothetical protein